MAARSSILAWIIPTDRGAWWPIVHGVAKSQIRLKLNAHTRIRQGFHDRAPQCAISGQLAAKRDFPSGPVVKTPVCNTGDTGSIPGLGTKISHAMGS